MAREALDRNSLNVSMDSDLDPEKSILSEIRKGYQESKTKARVAKAERRRRFVITSAFIFSVFTVLMMILYFSGLLWLKGLPDLKFLFMG
jgi:type IV secretory pathway component VirB8